MGKRREYGNIQIGLPAEMSERIIAWGRKWIPDSAICTREDNIHLTILYGLTDHDPVRVAEVLKNLKPFPVALGKISLFRNETFDVVKVDVWSDGAVQMNRILRENLPYKNSFVLYKPHVTIAYVHKGTGDACDQEEPFRGEKFTASSVEFRSVNGCNTQIDLLGGMESAIPEVK